MTCHRGAYCKATEGSLAEATEGSLVEITAGSIVDARRNGRDAFIVSPRISNRKGDLLGYLLISLIIDPSDFSYHTPGTKR